VRPRSSSFAHADPIAVAPDSTRKDPKKGQGVRDVLSIVGVLASALILAFCLITFVFQSYQVDGPSMQTTLENRDHLIVWKVPKTISNLTGKPYIPNRGDVIVFNEPSAGGGESKQLIKRVLAQPGERITVKNDVVTVYNEEHPEGFNPDRTLPYGSVITNTPGNVDVTLRESEVFVVGDNRTNSLDSRVFGPIDADQIVGKLVLRVLPLNTVTRF
jgi:signal peptidase I